MQITSSSDLDLRFGWLEFRFIAYAELSMHFHAVSKYKEGGRCRRCRWRQATDADRCFGSQLVPCVPAQYPSGTLVNMALARDLPLEAVSVYHFNLLQLIFSMS